MSLKRILIRRLSTGLALFAAIAALAVPYFSTHHRLPTDRERTFNSYALDFPERLMAEHDCWSGPAPADVVIPGHVVVRLKGDPAATYRGPKAVGLALDHLFTEPNPRVLTVYGFCR